MFALGVSFLYGLAVAAAIGVALTMVAALTLLPAMLGFIGPKVMSRKQKRNLAENGPRIVGADSKGFWPKWADRVQRYPWLLGRRRPGHHRGHRPALLLPAARLGRPGHRPGRDADPGRLRHALARASGPATTARLMLVAVVQPDQHQVIDDVVHAVSAAARRGQASPQPALHPEQDRATATWSWSTSIPTRPPRTPPPPTWSTTCAATPSPQAVGDSGVNVLVGGTTAIYIDFANVLSAKLPLFIGLVVMLSFLLLMTVFRVFVIPLTAAGHEPAVHRRRARHAGRRLPVGRPGLAHRPAAARARSRPSSP